jgi:PucR family transcriptional regulator, purine catabolism regulatory protein
MVRLLDVLGLDVFRKAEPEVVAGGHRLDREVRWVHTSELAEVAELLKGGELLLTTGLGLAGRGPVAQQQYISALHAHDVAGVALELGWTFETVPEPMAAKANQLGVPLIALHAIVPFVEITEAVQSGLLQTRYAQLRLDSDVDQILYQRLLQGRGLHTLVAEVAALLQCPAILESGGQVIASAGLTERATLRTALDDGPVDSIAVEVQGQNWGWLHLVEVREPDRAIVMAVRRRAPSAIALALLRDGQSRTLQARMANELIAELLTGRFGSRSDLAAQAKLVGFEVPADGPFMAFAVGGQVEDSRGLLVRATRLACSHQKTLVGESDDVVLGVIDARRIGDAQRLADTMFEGIRAALARHRLGGSPRVAVGPTVTGLEAVAISLRDARATLELCEKLGVSSGAVTSQGMSADRVLGRLLDDPVLPAVIDDQLGPLIGTGSEQSAVLVETLWAYLTYGSSKSDSACALHIRRQSLYKRLARITELIGDIDDPQRRLPLLMALRAHQLIGDRLRTRLAVGRRSADYPAAAGTAMGALAVPASRPG